MLFKSHLQIVNALQLSAAFILLFLFTACGKNNVTDTSVSYPADTTYGMVIADTITYEVIIVNPDSNDIYKAKFLGRLNHDAFLDSIFSLVLSERLQALEYGTNKALTPRDVMKIEAQEGFDRKNIGMIQFTEIWYLNASTGEMTKKVHSLIPGYNYYSEDGLVLGYTPLFVVELN